MIDNCKHGINKINVCTDCLAEKYGEAARELPTPTGSLPASSVRKLLARWESELLEWKRSVESWRKQEDTQSNNVRMNRCDARCRMLEVVIGEFRSEIAATNKRNPEENAQAHAPQT